MKRFEFIKLIAGSLVIIGAVMAMGGGNPNWLWLPIFVGVMLAQSSLTKICPMDFILKKLGVKE
ncbi:MAG: hypothetical protein UT66_C0001G0045 [candidate division CPR2 bacterium GW2011_GWC1_39_9]|uniref:Inner membrane protein YgaP-like transmembrane domain-containing protein n=1 Tax=candidate division CPR2 bacterium GW2011_GWC2_39_10 TaxID=1618345 RepID=A0A0G0PBE4_UNCC2|nr:MAG: hypothetical protein UT18_C0001G0046 [candidate division CPR2 bacterium GW2011_GWC2_39_10]KKR36221.1 MAG: hypothetical protein UT66_C0001G0045 [candidate division CPR2 bacterium GW2011_GWC1_39_9]